MWKYITLCMVLFLTLNAMETKNFREKSKNKQSFTLQSIPNDWDEEVKKLLGNKLKKKEALATLTILLNEYANKKISLGDKAHLTLIHRERSIWPCKSPKIIQIPTLYVSIECEHIACIRALLQHNINLDIKYNNQTPLEFAQTKLAKSSKHKKEIISLLKSSNSIQQTKQTIQKKSDLIPL